MNTFVNVCIIVTLGFLLLFFLIESVKKIKKITSKEFYTKNVLVSNKSAIQRYKVNDSVNINILDKKSEEYALLGSYYILNSVEKPLTTHTIYNRKKEIVEMK